MSSIKRNNWHLSRRTVLRSTGAAIAIPWLEVMTPPSRAAAANLRAPVRMAYVYFPNGVNVDHWTPKKDAFSGTLSPIRQYKSDVNVLKQLWHKQNKGDGHYSRTAVWLTGGPVTKTADASKVNTSRMSADQMAAREVGRYTRLASLELACSGVSTRVDRNVNMTQLYGSHISWKNATTPTGREIQPRLVFDRLFRGNQRRPSTAGQPARDAALFGGGGAPAAEINDDKSILDAVLADAKRLKNNVSSQDRRKLDEYLEAVRDVEKQIAFGDKKSGGNSKAKSWRPRGNPNMKAPAEGRPKDHAQHVKLMLDLMTVAFWTDTTRISTFMFANAVAGTNFSFLDGVKGAHHQISHHRNDKHNKEMYAKISYWHMQQLAYLLGRMKSIDEGGSSLLDNSMVLFGSSLSDGNRHNPSDLPLVLAGKGGGSIKTGRVISSKKNTPMCNLHVAMLQRMGVKTNKFGDSSGALNLK